MAIENFTPICKVNYVMVGQDGNAFALMGGFAQQARRDGWDKGDIDKVINEAMTGDYNHLLTTLATYCVNHGMGSYEDDEDEEDH
jgi:hypothetical protein